MKYTRHSAAMAKRSNSIQRIQLGNAVESKRPRYLFDLSTPNEISRLECRGEGVTSGGSVRAPTVGNPVTILHVTGQKKQGVKARNHEKKGNSSQTSCDSASSHPSHCYFPIKSSLKLFFLSAGDDDDRSRQTWIFL